MSESRVLKVGLNGAGGRMGQMLVSLIAKESDLKLVAALEEPGYPKLGQDAGLVAGVGELGVSLASEPIERPDVMIDFSLPAGTVKCVERCQEDDIPAVIGTTGLSDQQVKAIVSSSRRIPIVLAPNMSVGVNVLLAVVGQVARLLGPSYDVEIVETHHRFKKDAPSGTALKLAERIAEALDRDMKKDLVFGRHGQVGARTPREIGVHAVRAGDVVGDHVVTFATLGERIELVHRAHSRETFARGALRAARFVVGQPARLYTMDDVLGI